MQADQVSFFCECKSGSCVRGVDMTIGELLSIRGEFGGRIAIIAQDCPHGPEPGEAVLKRTPRYIVVDDSDPPPPA